MEKVGSYSQLQCSVHYNEKISQVGAFCETVKLWGAVAVCPSVCRSVRRCGGISGPYEEIIVFWTLPAGAL